MTTPEPQPDTIKILALKNELAKEMGDYGRTPGINEVLIQVIVANAQSGAFDVFHQGISEKEKRALSWLTPICTAAAAQSLLDSASGVGEGLHGRQVTQRFFEYYASAVLALNEQAANQLPSSES